MFLKLLLWLDGSPTHYWTVAWICFGIVVMLGFASFCIGRANGWWQHPVLMGCAILIALLAFRWPELLDNRQYPDPDESQFIAGASTLRQDPIFWRSVDGTTHGPLTEGPLVIALLLRGSIDFTTARTASLLLAWLGILSAWLMFRHLYTSRIAGLLILPLLAVHAFTHGWSFVAYCSEHVPNALLAMGCYALFTAWQPSGSGPPDLSRLFTAAVLLGAIPFAKLQAAPIGLVALCGGGWFALTNESSSWHQRVRALGALFIGAVTVSVIIVVLVVAFGIWQDFFSCYVLDNLRYAAANQFPPDRSITWQAAPAMLFELGGSVGGFNEFAVWMTLFGACGLFFLSRFTRWHRRCALVSAALLVIAAIAAMAPGRPYLHYLQLMIFPAGLFAGLIAGAFLSDVVNNGLIARGRSNLSQVVVVSFFLVCGLVLQIWWRVFEAQPFLGIFTATHGLLAQSQVSREILQHANPGERLGMWGWMPVFWVETGLIQATRDGQTARQIEPHPRRDYYRARFLKDLVRNRPPIFIDAVGVGNFVYEDRAKCGHETFPALRDYVDQNYYLVRDLNGTRIYVRNDRL